MTAEAIDSTHASPRLEPVIPDELADDEAQRDEARVARCRLQSERLILGDERRQERDAQDRGGDGVHSIEDQPAVGGHCEEARSLRSRASPASFVGESWLVAPERDRELERGERDEDEDGHIDSDETDEDPGHCQRRQQDLNRPGRGQDDRRCADRRRQPRLVRARSRGRLRLRDGQATSPRGCPGALDLWVLGRRVATAGLSAPPSGTVVRAGLAAP